MRRDWNLIREIVLIVEERVQHGGGDVCRLYHQWLVHGMGLAQGTAFPATRDHAASALLYALTPAGHEFADLCRDDAPWTAAMERVAKSGGSVCFEVLLRVLKQEQERRLHPLTSITWVHGARHDDEPQAIIADKDRLPRGGTGTEKRS